MPKKKKTGCCSLNSDHLMIIDSLRHFILVRIKVEEVSFHTHDSVISDFHMGTAAKHSRRQRNRALPPPFKNC